MVTFGRKLPIGILLRIFANKAIYTLTRWYWFGKSLLLSLSNLILKDVRTYLKAWLWRSWRTMGETSSVASGFECRKYDTIESLKAILSNQLTQRESIYRKREDALQQINEKDYAAPFKKDKRKLIKVGVEFSAETRNVKRWLVG